MTEVKLNESIDLEVARVKKNNNTRKTNNSSKPRTQRYRITEESIKLQLTKAIENVGGKYVQFENVDHSVGLLVAAVKNTSIDSSNPNEQYFFVIVNKDRKVEFVNSNEHFSVIHDMPSSLYVLNYVYQREPENISEMVEDALTEDNIEVLLASSKIKKSRSNNTNRKNFKKNKNNKNVKKTK